MGHCCGPWAGRRWCPGRASEGGRSGGPAVAYYSAREEGTGGAGTLREESLWLGYMPPSHDWWVPPLALT